ncbi:MAG: Beta-galactosidase [Candidatus Dichloromethanomonas elyunquensis]|nr:MAG: Beta-galactosidase [Candidatus Dichloromethanomonas elyunquensis]
MFNRFLALIIVLFFLLSPSLSLLWKDVPAKGLFGDSPVANVYRISQDLGGKWDSFTSLRQAWAEENRNLQGNTPKAMDGFFQNSFIIPSDREFHVAAKKFKVTGKWRFKTVQLVLSGVYGKARIFLNGIDEVNYLGDFEGAGGTYTLDVSSARFDFNRENVLYIELSKGNLGQKKILGWLWPENGRITGQIRLEAVSETTIDAAETTVSYDPANRKLIVHTGLRHHLTLDHGPWAINAILKDKDQKVAECLLPLNSNGEFEQTVALMLDLPEAKLWSPENPNLYDLNLVLSNSQGDYDSVQMPIGVKYTASSNNQWSLNQQKFEAKGEIISAQQSYLITTQQQLEDYIRQIKAKGLNIIYFMGFFPDENWLFCTDRLGIGVWVEMPAAFASKEKIPSCNEFQELLLTAKRHPSVLALTAGKELEPSAQADAYMQDVKQQIPDVPVYNLKIFPNSEKTNSQTILLGENGLQGQWGKVSENKSFLSESEQTPNTSWRQEKYAAILWLIWLFFLCFQNGTSVKWNYPDLFSNRPKRAVRTALFWGALMVVSRMITLGAVLTALFFQIPIRPLCRIPYDINSLISLRSQAPVLLWLLLSFFFVLLKIFQAGLAAAWLPDKPGALGLCCWLERRSNWIVLAGAAWVISLYWQIGYLPVLVYAGFSLLCFPWRIRDVWKAGGKYRSFMILPVTFLLGITIPVVIHWVDFLYLAQLLLPALKGLLPFI